MDPEVWELARRYGLATWFAEALVVRLGAREADARCTEAARRWRSRIRRLCGRNVTGLNDLEHLRRIYERELARLFAAAPLRYFPDRDRS